MTRFKRLGFTLATALIFAACGESALANESNHSGKPDVSGPSKETIVALEKSAYEAWKSRSANFWSTFLSENFVGWGSHGKVNKALAVKEHIRTDCEVKRYALSDENVRSLGESGALLTYQATVDGTCGGEKLPTNSRAATIYAFDGKKWKPVFHAELEIVDPKQALGNAAKSPQQPGGDAVPAADRTPNSDELLPVEKQIWDAWRTQNIKKLAELTADDISFINIFGTYFANKTDALHDWSGAYCDVKSVNFTDATATMVSPTVGILTFKAAADGTCNGFKVGVVWGSSVYVKSGNTWKWTFGINLPGR